MLAQEAETEFVMIGSKGIPGHKTAGADSFGLSAAQELKCVDTKPSSSWLSSIKNGSDVDISRSLKVDEALGVVPNDYYDLDGGQAVAKATIQRLAAWWSQADITFLDDPSSMWLEMTTW
ncbi:hypothetical protein FJTKL_03172 [Diaporthe vaccinii]|uniref:Uncharacterized protein n=1 Tax=Diaporthe vaccinii TaxID=105482 RepID=A0ABR4DVV5_9PEZI